MKDRSGKVKEERGDRVDGMDMDMDMGKDKDEGRGLWTGEANAKLEGERRGEGGPLTLTRTLTGHPDSSGKEAYPCSSHHFQVWMPRSSHAGGL